MTNLLSNTQDLDITSNCKNGRCSNCGECCTDFIPLTKAEVKNIKAYIKKNNIKENVYVDEEHFDLRCPFYLKDNEHHCAIYPVRPTICRSFKCCFPKKLIEKNRDTLSFKADYNMFYNHTYHGTMISLHNLFYNNVKYEIQALYSMCNFDENAFKNFSSDCLTKYILEN